MGMKALPSEQLALVLSLASRSDHATASASQIHKEGWTIDASLLLNSAPISSSRKAAFVMARPGIVHKMLV